MVFFNGRVNGRKDKTQRGADNSEVRERGGRWNGREIG
jgi:hypothetical protein